MFKKNYENIELFNKALIDIRIPNGMEYQLPPNSTAMLNCEHLNYKDRCELVNRYFIGNEFSNPQGTVQGGVIAACFDDTFGPLGVVTARNPIVTIDMNIQYIRAISVDEDFFIQANIVSVAKSTIFIEAKAFNCKGKLLAKASTNQLILR